LHLSKLQVCVKVLCVLSVNGPLSFRQICRKEKLDSAVLENHLGFLADKGLVEKQKRKYSVTDRGHSVLKVLAPLVKEAHRLEVQSYDSISSALDQASSSFEKKRRWKLSDFIKIRIVEEE
jgi:DNA-binding HxlR family transcriptional regulator